MSQARLFDSIVVGAGWSGAVAAREIAKKGHSVLVLEARDRVGGRASTWKKDGAKVDVGCSWIHGYKEGNPAKEIAKEYGVAAHLPKAFQGVIYGPDGRLDTATADALRASLSAAQGAYQLPHPPPPPTASLAAALLGQSSPLFAQSKPPKDLAVALARSLEIPLGLTLEQASLKWAGWESVTNYSGSDAAPEGGYEALVGQVIKEAEAKGAVVKLDAQITKVQETKDGVAITDSAGQVYQAKTAVITIPLGVLKTLPPSTFDPALPPHRQETIKGTHVGVLEKLLLQYPSAWWPDAQTTGSYTFLPSSTPSTSPTSLKDIFESATLVTANFAAPSLPDPAPILLTYLSETPARALLKSQPSEVAEAFHQFLVDRFKPASQPPAPTASALTQWLTDPLSLGATTTPSIVSEHGERSPLDFKELGRPVWDGRLGFAGEHTEMEHRGSVAGAVISGFREADRVNKLLGLIDA